jgi:gliding motility-associated lipoprotein GldH
MTIYRSILVLLISCCLITGCSRFVPDFYYQSQTPIPQNAWNYNFKPTFTFDITDTDAYYRPYFIIRHTQAYAYNNIWMWVYIKTPGDTNTKKARINITLAEQTGKWLGRGMGEIYEQRMPVSFGDSVNFSRKGTYKISLEQNMRLNPLPDVLNVGFRLEKVAPRRN